MTTYSPITKLLLTAAAAFALLPATALAADRAALERDARAALQTLTGSVPAAKSLSGSAGAVLVFPKVTKAGLGVGGQTGDGVLFKQGKVGRLLQHQRRLRRAAGRRAAVQLRHAHDERQGGQRLSANEGFEVGVGPSVVVMDEGKAKTMTTTTAKDDIYAFIFGQKGLMAGLGVQGNKITRLKD